MPAAKKVWTGKLMATAETFSILGLTLQGCNTEKNVSSGRLQFIQSTCLAPDSTFLLLLFPLSRIPDNGEIKN